MLFLVTRLANHSQISPPVLYTQLLPWHFLLDIALLFLKINLPKTSHISNLHFSVNLPFCHKVISLPKNRRRKLLAWSQCLAALLPRLLVLCKSSSSLDWLTLGTAVPLCPLWRACANSCSQSVPVAELCPLSPQKVFLSKLTAPGEAELQYPAWLITYISPSPAPDLTIFSLLPAMLHLFSSRPHLSSLQTFETQRFTCFPVLFFVVLCPQCHKKKLSTDKNQGDCTAFGWFKEKRKAVSQVKSCFPCLIWAPLEN